MFETEAAAFEAVHWFKKVRTFVQESNRIGGITRPPLKLEVNATVDFIALKEMDINALEVLVDVYAPGHILRRHNGLDIHVGRHYPPPGGSNIEEELTELLRSIKEDADPTHLPRHFHKRYEDLHPFTDCNGRSGRALWAWCMLQDGQDPFSLPFLHRFYYQTLQYAPPLLHRRT